MKDQCHLRVLYEKSHDGNHRAWVSMLPTCPSSGPSLTQARARISEAVRCCCFNMLENGAAIPQSAPGLPSVVDEIQANLGNA